jgi:hypothetical protein
MESNAALERTSRIVVLNADAFEHLRRPVVQANRDHHPVFAHWCPQQIVGSAIETQSVGSAIEPRLRLVERGLCRKSCLPSNERF